MNTLSDVGAAMAVLPAHFGSPPHAVVCISRARGENGAGGKARVIIGPALPAGRVRGARKVGGPHGQPIYYAHLGEATVPGPTTVMPPAEEETHDNIDIETIHISNLVRHQGAVKYRVANILFVQEHTTRSGACKAACAELRKANYDAHMGPVAMVGVQPTAGVGYVLRQHAAYNVIEVERLSPNTICYRDAGRYYKYRACCKGLTFIV